MISRCVSVLLLEDLAVEVLGGELVDVSFV